MKELRLKATLGGVKEVLAMIDSELNAHHCPMETRVELDVAVEELYVNIANYAYAPDTGEALVRIVCEERPAACEITFIDNGIPFDPLAKPDPDLELPIEERPIGGLGIYMVKNSMDGVYYERKDGQNILTIRKLFETKEN